MKHIKELNSKCCIVQKGEDILILCKKPGNKQGDKLISFMLEDLEDRIISFTDELESKLNDIYNSIQKKCSDLSNSVSKMPSKEEVDTSMILDTVDKLAKIKADAFDNLEEIFNYVDNSLNSTFDEDIHILRFSSLIARDLGDVQEAIKIEELTKKRLRQLSDLVFDLCRSTEEKINVQIISILNLIEHKYRISRFLKNDNASFNNSEDSTPEHSANSIKKEDVRIPRTNLELKKHLKKQGFELHRHNGSHQIYKNEEGEVRLIPARRGNHVLAAKTAKKIYQGVAVANE